MRHRSNENLAAWTGNPRCGQTEQDDSDGQITGASAHDHNANVRNGLEEPNATAKEIYEKRLSGGRNAIWREWRLLRFLLGLEPLN